MAAEAMFSCPSGAALNTRVSILGQHSPTPIPTPSSGAISQFAPPCCDKPAIGSIQASTASDAADITGPATISRLAVPVERLELMNEPKVQPADISAVQ